jgi:hypothetical protein
MLWNIAEFAAFGKPQGKKPFKTEHFMISINPDARETQRAEGSAAPAGHRRARAHGTFSAACSASAARPRFASPIVPPSNTDIQRVKQ